MNESSGNVTDYSGNGYTGTVNGAPTRAISVYGGNTGIQLTASGHGVSINKNSCPLARDAMLSQNYTASMVFENSSSGVANSCPFIFWTNAIAGRKVLRLGNNTPRYASWTANGGGSDYGGISVAGSGLQIVTYTRTPTLGSLYSNGVLIGTSVYSSGITVEAASSDLIQVGGHLNFPSSYQYVGKASDLNIWSTALSAGEVAQLATQNGRY